MVFRYANTIFVCVCVRERVRCVRACECVCVRASVCVVCV